VKPAEGLPNAVQISRSDPTMPCKNGAQGRHHGMDSLWRKGSQRGETRDDRYIVGGSSLASGTQPDDRQTREIEPCDAPCEETN
jgi:hypothetical protein